MSSNTPELLQAGREHADRLGVALDWREADAEDLPFDEGAFDVVVSCLGVMFAPNHQLCANELLRVCRPGGTLGLASWTPERFIGQMLTTMQPYAPTPPPGSQPSVLWGSELHLRHLLGERVEWVTMCRKAVTVDRFATPEAFRDYFKDRYGPTIATYRALGDDADRVAALDHALAELAHRHDRGAGATVMDWEYLLATARKRP